MKKNLSNKRILIIGSSRGIGFEIAKYLHNHNSKVIISSSNYANLDSAYNEILESNKSKNKKLYKITIDIGNISNLVKDIKKTLNFFSKLDVLIISSAILGPSGKLYKNNFTNWRKTFDINLFGPVKVIQYFLKLKFFSNNAKIIFISGGISAPDPYFTSFNASKHALNGFANSLSEQLYNNKIWVNSILPGSYNTKMNKIRIMRGPKQIGRENYKIALSRVNQNEEILYKNLNELIFFLCSDRSNEITGRTISAQYDNWKKNIKFIKNNNNNLYKIIREK